MNITFQDVLREVPGSSFLMETAITRFLVGCDIVQGERGALTCNHKPLAADPAKVA